MVTFLMSIKHAHTLSLGFSLALSDIKAAGSAPYCCFPGALQSVWQGWRGKNNNHREVRHKALDRSSASSFYNYLYKQPHPGPLSCYSQSKDVFHSGWETKTGALNWSIITQRKSLTPLCFFSLFRHKKEDCSVP